MGFEEPFCSLKSAHRKCQQIIWSKSNRHHYVYIFYIKLYCLCMSRQPERAMGSHQRRPVHQLSSCADSSGSWVRAEREERGEGGERVRGVRLRRTARDEVGLKGAAVRARCPAVLKPDGHRGAQVAVRWPDKPGFHQHLLWTLEAWGAAVHLCFPLSLSLYVCVCVSLTVIYDC